MISTNLIKTNVQPSLKENIELGRNVLKTITAEFPVIKSSTKVDAFMMKVANNENFSEHYWDILKLRSYYRWNCMFTRLKTYTKKVKSLKDAAERLEYLLRECPFANCREQGHLVKYKLSQKNTNPVNIVTNVFGKNGNRIPEKEHMFTVIGLDRNAYADMPSTWGNKAVVVDSYCNISMPAKDALEFYKDYFSVNPTCEKVLTALPPIQL